MKKASPMRSLIAWERLSMITDIMLDALRGLPRRFDYKGFKDSKAFKELKIKHIWSDNRTNRQRIYAGGVEGREVGARRSVLRRLCHDSPIMDGGVCRKAQTRDKVKSKE